MHIFFPIGSYYPAQSGGPNNTVYWLAKALVRAGHQVTVVSTDRDLPADITVNTWTNTDHGRVRYERTRIANAPLRQLWRCLTVRSADVVHLTSLFYPLSLPMAIWSVLGRRRVIWSVHGELDPEALIYQPVLKRLFLWAIRALRRRVQFHSTCKAESAYIRQRIGADSNVIELTNFMELPPLLHRQADVTLLYIGRLHPKKAVERLIEAVATSSVFNTGQWRLLVAGDDRNAYADGLKKQVAQHGLTDRICFTGPITGYHKQQLFANAHVTVLPSHTENFGLVVTESMAQGTPVIASTGTPWQLLEQEYAGRWVDNDADSLKAAIDFFLAMPPTIYGAYRTRALNVVQTRFNVHGNIHQWLTQYAQT